MHRSGIADVMRMDEKMSKRLEWSDVKMLRASLVLLNTQSWYCHAEGTEEEDENLAEVREGVESISSQFREPRETNGVVLVGIQDEIVQYTLSKKVTRKSPHSTIC